jgi:Tol biopolymer transport system component
MPSRRLLLVPIALLAGAGAYAFAVPSHRSAGQSSAPTEVATTTASPAVTATAGTTPVAPATGIVPGLPPGLSGKLTYRTDREQVTVAFPSGAAIAHGPMDPISAAEPSADGLWSSTTDCSTLCRTTLKDTNGNARAIDDPYIGGLHWSPQGHELALASGPSNGGYPASDRLVLIDDPASTQPHILYETRKGLAHPFEWLSSGDLLIADNSDTDARLMRVTTGGDATLLATVPSTVWYLYASPDGRTVAFTQDSPQGWQLWTVDGTTGEVRNAGNMGSDPAGIAPPQENPPLQEKGPMYVAWSPDGSKVAFGGGYQPPYTMTIADIATGAKHRTEFPDGYPGEIKWSPDGKKLAVSSYNVPRTHHEAYVVDPETGIARDVLSGCVIVWSPDSQFLAVHGEREPGIAIADVVTLQHAQLTHTPGDTPLSWSP